MTLARDLSFSTLKLITNRLPELRELTGPEGGPYRRLSSATQAEAGAVRIWQGEKVRRVVYIGITHDMPMRDGSGRSMLLDSHMIFGFTPKESAIPHFTLDAVAAGPMFAFHLDLIPRVDLGANLAYMDAVYGGAVTEAQAEAHKVQGFVPAPLTSRQLSLMSPWMLASRANADAFRKIPVQTYFERWASLLEQGLPPAATEGLSADDFARRDRQNRAALFNKDVDPVWGQIESFIGESVGQDLRALLQRQDAE